jgi:hypothetical protein
MFLANNQALMILKISQNSLISKNLQKSLVNLNRRKKSTLLLLPHLHQKQSQKNLKKWRSKIQQKI